MHPNVLSARRERLRTLLERRQLAGALITHPKHIYYFTGFLPAGDHWRFLLITPVGATLLLPECDGRPDVLTGDIVTDHFADFLNAGRAASEEEYARQSLAGAVGDLFPRGVPIGIEGRHLTVGVLEMLQGAYGWKAIDAELEGLRAHKDAEEITLLGRNALINDVALAKAREVIRPGESELIAYAKVWHALEMAAGQQLLPACDFASGVERTVAFGDIPTDKVVESGDLFIVDIYPFIDGYCADITRNYVVGSAQLWQREVHAILEDALAAGAAAIRPGVEAGAIDRAAREVIRKAGYGDYFPIGCGHGIGLFLHEAPSLIPNSHERIVEGMVFTVEPGIYLPGKGGMRLEQDYVVTADGCRGLSQFPLKLIECV